MPKGKDQGGPVARGIVRIPMIEDVAGKRYNHERGPEVSSNEHYIGGNMYDRSRSPANACHQGTKQGMGDRQQGKGGASGNGFGAPPGATFKAGAHVGETKPTKGGAGQSKRNY